MKRALCLGGVFLFWSMACGSDSPDDSYQPGLTGLPAGSSCADVANWDPEWVAFEDRVLVLTNERRAEGASCGTGGTFFPADPLTLNLVLRCTARQHSKDMAERSFFDHTNPDNETPFDRITANGYIWRAAGENIAAGATTPEAVVEGWMNSPGHCSNIMEPDFEELGVGYFASTESQYGVYWTQVFGQPGP